MIDAGTSAPTPASIHGGSDRSWFIRSPPARSHQREAPEALGVADTGLTAGLLGSLPQEATEELGGVRQLAAVTEERVDLGVQRVGDVDPHVGLECARQVDA